MNTTTLTGLALLASLAACSRAGSDAAADAAPVETSVKPGINESYLDPQLDVDAMVERFEVESREIAANRDAIVAAIGLEPGDDLADIGAGTGLFLEPFAAAIGSGTLFAVDIAEPFIAHLGRRAKAAGLDNVRPVLCVEDHARLEPASIDVAFICDTYHHFEYPRSTTTSIRDALRPGGELFVVDFERIPGVSRDWILGHVRAGKETVIAEIESFGFELVEEVDVSGLEENFALRFRRHGG